MELCTDRHFYFYILVTLYVDGADLTFRIYIPLARQSVSLRGNGNEDLLFFPRESFTFRDRREEGQVV